MTEAEAKGMVEAKLRCMELEGLSCVEKGCDRDCDACKYNYLQGTVGEHKEALRMAIKALEKQIAKKPISTDWLRCPTCNVTLKIGLEKYCEHCGQRLKWVDSEV